MSCSAISRSRHRVLPLVLAASLLLGSATMAGAAGSSFSADDQLVAYDLARLSPGLAELDAVGLGDLNTIGAATMSTVPDYLYLEAPYSEAEQELIDTIEDAGFVRAYRSEWTDRAAQEGAVQGDSLALETDAYFALAQAEDADGAAAIWTAFDDSDDEHVDDPAELGDRSEFHPLELEPGTGAGEGAGGEALTGISGNVLLGNVILSIELVTTPDSPFAEDTEAIVHEMMGSLVDRLSSLETWPTDTIALDVARFAGQDAAVVRDSYDLLNGQANMATIGISAEDRDAAAERAREAGMVDQYDAIHQIDASDSMDSAPQLWDFIRSFESDDAASDWIDDTVMEYWASGGWDVETLDNITTPGDDAIVLEASNPDGTRFFSVAVWRDGTTVHQLAIRRTEGYADRDALQAYIDLTADCVAAGDCWQPHDLPEVLADALA